MRAVEAEESDRGQAREDILDRYERQRRTIAIEYINASTARNKKEIEERDPVLHKKMQDESIP